jgi:hypothetical protein
MVNGSAGADLAACAADGQCRGAASGLVWDGRRHAKVSEIRINFRASQCHVQLVDYFMGRAAPAYPFRDLDGPCASGCRSPFEQSHVSNDVRSANPIRGTLNRWEPRAPDLEP